MSRAGRSISAAVVYGFGALGIFAAGWWELGLPARRKRPPRVAWIGVALAIPCLLLALSVPPGQAWYAPGWCRAHAIRVLRNGVRHDSGHHRAVARRWRFTSAAMYL